MYDSFIFWVYHQVKNFPENSRLMTNPKKNNGTITITIAYGFIATVLTIMIIASVINYEVIFRETGRTENEEYTKDYYSKPENAMGQPFFITLIIILCLFLFRGAIYYRETSNPKLPFFILF